MKPRIFIILSFCVLLLYACNKEEFIGLKCNYAETYYELEQSSAHPSYSMVSTDTSVYLSLRFYAQHMHLIELRSIAPGFHSLQPAVTNTPAEAKYTIWIPLPPPGFGIATPSSEIYDNGTYIHHAQGGIEILKLSFDEIEMNFSCDWGNNTSVRDGYLHFKF